MTLGVAGSVVPRDPRDITDEWAARWAALEVRSVVTHFELEAAEPVGDIARKVRAVLDNAGIQIVQFAGVNANLVEPRDEVRAAEIDRLVRHLGTAASYGAARVLTGCGSLSATAFYGPHPDNHREDTRDRLVESLRAVAARAEEVGVEVCLEPHCLTTLDTPSNVRDILRDVGSRHMTVNFDPVNFVSSLWHAYATTSFFREAYRVLAECVAPTVHLKDLRVSDGLVVHIDEAVPGEGLVDFTALLNLFRDTAPQPALIVEHLPEEHLRSAINHIRACALSAGLTLS